MKKLSAGAAALIFFTAALSAQTAQELKFQYKADDNYRILSTVDELVKVNGIPNHQAEIVSRVAVRITSVENDGSASHEATFITSENSKSSQTGANLSWGEEFSSKFKRDAKGHFDISDEYFMPVIRDLPVFPDKAIKPGDSWTSQGYEAHDLRRTFQIEKPVLVPFAAKYVYLHDEPGESSDSSKTKKTFQVISAKYSLFYESPEPKQATYADYPATTMGYSDRLIWWDNEKGHIDHYTETFRIVIETVNGNQYDFSGRTIAEVTEFKRTSTDENLKVVRQKIEDMGIKDVSVSKSEKGLTISLENIQFLADSSILMETEKEKIRKISQILSAYPDNDLLIAGHTARVGTEESCQILSEERAASVAQFLIGLGVKDKYHIIPQGFGSKVPVASNKTEAGKAKNRRVEFTILDK